MDNFRRPFVEVMSWLSWLGKAPPASSSSSSCGPLGCFGGRAAPPPANSSAARSYNGPRIANAALGAAKPVAVPASRGFPPAYKPPSASATRGITDRYTPGIAPIGEFVTDPRKRPTWEELSPIAGAEYNADQAYAREAAERAAATAARPLSDEELHPESEGWFKASYGKFSGLWARLGIKADDDAGYIVVDDNHEYNARFLIYDYERETGPIIDLIMQRFVNNKVNGPERWHLFHGKLARRNGVGGYDMIHLDRGIDKPPNNNDSMIYEKNPYGNNYLGLNLRTGLLQSLDRTTITLEEYDRMAENMRRSEFNAAGRMPVVLVNPYRSEPNPTYNPTKPVEAPFSDPHQALQREVWDGKTTRRGDTKFFTGSRRYRGGKSRRHKSKGQKSKSRKNRKQSRRR